MMQVNVNQFRKTERCNCAGKNNECMIPKALSRWDITNALLLELSEHIELITLANTELTAFTWTRVEAIRYCRATTANLLLYRSDNRCKTWKARNRKVATDSYLLKRVFVYHSQQHIISKLKHSWWIWQCRCKHITATSRAHRARWSTCLLSSHACTEAAVVHD